MRTLTREEWKLVFMRLSSKLEGGTPVKMGVIGGVAMLLGYDARRSTDDADSLLDAADSSRVILAADDIADECGLKKGWLNEKAKEAGYVSNPEEGEILIDTPSLKIYMPSLLHMALKLAATKRGGNDITDAALLVRKCRQNWGMQSAEELFDRVGGLVRVEDRGSARYYLEDVWELSDEPESTSH